MNDWEHKCDFWLIGFLRDWNRLGFIIIKASQVITTLVTVQYSKYQHTPTLLDSSVFTFRGSLKAKARRRA